MGMTDKQFDNHIRELIYSLERALRISPDNEEIVAMITRYRTTLED